MIKCNMLGQKWHEVLSRAGKPRCGTAGGVCVWGGALGILPVTCIFTNAGRTSGHAVEAGLPSLYRYVACVQTRKQLCYIQTIISRALSRAGVISGKGGECPTLIRASALAVETTEYYDDKQTVHKTQL